MSRYNFHMTETAFNHLDDIVYKTALDRGPDQAEKYKSQQLAGFEQIAKKHKTMRTPHREDLAKGTSFKVHHVEHHYVAYQSHDEHNVIIAGVFHERMDLPTKLKELENLSRHEISALKREIDKGAAQTAAKKPPRLADRPRPKLPGKEAEAKKEPEKKKTKQRGRSKHEVIDLDDPALEREAKALAKGKGKTRDDGGRER